MKMKGGAMPDKEYYMKLALQLAESVIGQTSPNPPVGCVVVKDGKIIGVGVHLKAGEPHAEVNALRQAGENAKGADLYVTLEPCSHTGRTPPCADLLIRRKLKNVYIAALDPNPIVAGKGVSKLREAGIHVESGVCEHLSTELYKHYFHFMKTNKPFVTLKTAVTFDGKTAASSGNSKWITSEEARKDVHEYRHRHDAILVGINTVLADNPHLTTRLPQGGTHPIRIVLDTSLQIPLDANMLQDGTAPVIVVCGEGANQSKQAVLEENGVKVKRMPSRTIDISSLLEWLGEEQITSLFVEGGNTVHSSFMKESAFQEIIMYMAPVVLCDNAGRPSFGGPPKELIKEGVPLQFQSVETIGPDIKITAVPKERGDDDVHRDR
jgi:diaminohydroxyphosphoribosylaminopyrimidine deaminase/5-amino-6-(5-phosphoribosylamino)uracil reductase